MTPKSEAVLAAGETPESGKGESLTEVRDAPAAGVAKDGGPAVVGLRFGAIAPKLVDQLASQGITVDGDILAPFQTDADSLTALSMRGLLTDSAVRAARGKLADRILSGLSS